MRIGFVTFSLKQGITYMSCLVSLGYEVIPIVVSKDNLTGENDFIINMIKDIVNREILFINNISLYEKLDAIIVVGNNIPNIDFLSLLKENAPIILNLNHYHDNILTNYSNIQITAYNPQDIIENCNHIVTNLEKVLKK